MENDTVINTLLINYVIAWVGTLIIYGLIFTFFNGGLAEDGMEDVFEASSLVNVIAGFGWLFSFLSLVGIIAGIIAIVFFKGN